MNAPERRPRDVPHTARSAAVWLAVYLLVVTAPIFALLPSAIAAAGSGTAWDFAMALGYAALAMFGVQFALTARFKRATAPFGIDIVYYFHRYLAIVALAIVLAHLAIVVAVSPALLNTVDPRIGPAHMSAGWIALVLFVVLVLSSLARRALGLEYDHWRVAHALLAVAAFALALAHLLGAGHYLDTAWKRALWIGYGAMWLGLIAYVRVLRPWRLKRAPWRVVEVRRERGRVWTAVLEPRKPGRLHFSPGQFVWFTLRASPFAMREHPVFDRLERRAGRAHRAVDQGTGRLHRDHQGRRAGRNSVDRRAVRNLRHRSPAARRRVRLHRRRNRRRADHVDAANPGRPRRPSPAVAVLRQSRMGSRRVPGGARTTRGQARPAAGAHAAGARIRMARRARLCHARTCSRAICRRRCATSTSAFFAGRRR